MRGVKKRKYIKKRKDKEIPPEKALEILRKNFVPWEVERVNREFYGGKR